MSVSSPSAYAVVLLNMLTGHLDMKILFRLLITDQFWHRCLNSTGVIHSGHKDDLKIPKEVVEFLIS